MALGDNYEGKSSLQEYLNAWSVTNNIHGGQVCQGWHSECWAQGSLLETEMYSTEKKEVRFTHNCAGSSLKKWSMKFWGRCVCIHLY